MNDPHHMSSTVSRNPFQHMSEIMVPTRLTGVFMAAALACAALVVAPVSASTLYWDFNGATPGFGGNITANTHNWSAATWNTDSTGGGGGTVDLWQQGSLAQLNTVNEQYTLNNDYAGGVNLTGITQAISSGSGRLLTITGGTLNFAAGSQINVSGTALVIQNATITGNVTIASGDVRWGDSVSYSDTLTVNSIFSWVNNHAGLANARIVNNGTLTVNSGNSGTGLWFQIGELSGTNVSANIALGTVGQPRNFQINQSTETTYAGRTERNPNATNISSMRMSGSGLLRTTGALAHDGGLFVDNGTLLVNGSWVQENNSGNDPGVNGNLAVANGARFGGIGTITLANARDVVVESGGILAPGNRLLAGDTFIGNLTFNMGSTTGKIDLKNGSILEFDLDVDGVSDRITLTNAAAGDVAFGGTTINFKDLGGLAAGNVYTLFSANVAGAYTGLTLDGDNKITAGLIIGSGLDAYAGSYLQLVGNDITLNVIPEPASLMLLAAGAMLMLPRRRPSRI